ncbi:aquaporin-1-like isoform X2 [Cynoglossus semilaevis]|uniref:aquaporin-1-like isoform X2 n=1 Tax=Cynoglossus semilaevis TaxID=244447 RepID=UPI000494F854|nr:aquaporin-1-like isoform X2 [Cynoglossus semilaevis]
MSEIKTWAFWRAVLAELLVYRSRQRCTPESCRHPGPPDQLPDQHPQSLLLHNSSDLGSNGWQCYCVWHQARNHRLTRFEQDDDFLNCLHLDNGGAQTELLSSLQLNDVSPGQGFTIEFLLTLQLVLCVLAVTDKRRDVGRFAPLSIGLSVGLGHLAGIRYTGCGINPARSFGPAVILKSFDDHWVYWAGPMSAAVVAALLYNFVLTSTDVTLNKKSRALLCESLSSENEFHEHVEDVKWSKEPGV